MSGALFEWSIHEPVGNVAIMIMRLASSSSLGLIMRLASSSSLGLGLMVVVGDGKLPLLRTPKRSLEPISAGRARCLKPGFHRQLG